MTIFTFILEIILMISGIISYVQEIVTRNYTGTALGNICSIKERKHNIYISTYSITVKYEVDNVEYINRHMKTVGNNCDYRVNQKLNVRYNQNNPKRSRIVEDFGFVSKEKLLILSAVMCITAFFILFHI